MFALAQPISINPEVLHQHLLDDALGRYGLEATPENAMRAIDSMKDFWSDDKTSIRSNGPMQIISQFQGVLIKLHSLQRKDVLTAVTLDSLKEEYHINGSMPYRLAMSDAVLTLGVPSFSLVEKTRKDFRYLTEISASVGPQLSHAAKIHEPRQFHFSQENPFSGLVPETKPRQSTGDILNEAGNIFSGIDARSKTFSMTSGVGKSGSLFDQTQIRLRGALGIPSESTVGEDNYQADLLDDASADATIHASDPQKKQSREASQLFHPSQLRRSLMAMDDQVNDLLALPQVAQEEPVKMLQPPFYQRVWSPIKRGWSKTVHGLQHVGKSFIKGFRSLGK